MRDEGPGIDPADADRIFEPFYRADPSRARASGGVGLGLAIVRAIVEAHGGTVSVQPGPGGAFMVRVPTRRHPTDGAAAGHGVGSGDSFARTAVRGRHATGRPSVERSRVGDLRRGCCGREAW